MEEHARQHSMRPAGRLEGHMARLKVVMNANSSVASRNRMLRNVSGSACGLAYLATIHPVDHSSTNRAGAIRSSVIGYRRRKHHQREFPLIKKQAVLQ
jgi:hypothetical protein